MSILIGLIVADHALLNTVIGLEALSYTNARLICYSTYLGVHNVIKVN